MSSQPCGCDPEANWVCARHDGEQGDFVKVPPETFDFTIKDSGKREQFAGGMVRDTTEGKTNFLLLRDGPMLVRWAIHLSKGAIKYAKRNWMLGRGQEELDRAKESAARHFEQWLRDETDEDHAAAVFFNINQVEYLKERIRHENLRSVSVGPSNPGQGSGSAASGGQVGRGLAVARPVGESGGL